MTFPTLRRRSCIHCKGSRTQGAELAARHAIVIAAGGLGSTTLAYGIKRTTSPV